MCYIAYITVGRGFYSRRLSMIYKHGNNMENVRKFYEALARDVAMQERAKVLNEQHGGMKVPEVTIREDIIAFARAEGYKITARELGEYRSWAHPLTYEELGTVAGGGGGCACFYSGSGSGTDRAGDAFVCECCAYGPGGGEGDEQSMCVCFLAGGG